jgi:hypothetical protein
MPPHAYLRNDPGRSIASSAGAMGMMPLMPATRCRYWVRCGRDRDPYRASNDTLGRAACRHELSERYGREGLPASYQAGPGRHSAFMRAGRPLLLKTLKRVARVRAMI